MAATQIQDINGYLVFDTQLGFLVKDPTDEVPVYYSDNFELIRKYCLSDPWKVNTEEAKAKIAQLQADRANASNILNERRARKNNHAINFKQYL